MRARELGSERLMDMALLQPHSRFLKPKTSSSSHVSLRAGQTGLPPAARSSPSAASQGRVNAVLRKLAHIESKIQRRKDRLGPNSSAAQQMLMGDELSWSKSSQDPEQEAGGFRSLKKEAKPREAVVPGADQSRNTPQSKRASLGRVKEDTGRFLDAAGRYKRQPFQNSRLKVPSRTPTSPPSQRLSSPGQGSLKRLLHRAPSPSSSRGTSPSLSPSVSSPLAGKASPQGSGRSLSEGSVIRSLDELFLGAADSQGSSSSDFHVKVLSLADLASSMAIQKEGLTAEETMMEAPGSLSTEQEQVLFLADPPSAPMGNAAALEDPGETEISEQLSGCSAGPSSGEPESLASAQYSEAFESLSEDTPRQASLEDLRDASPQAGLPGPPSPRQPLAGPQRSQSARPIITKEVAVQTDSSSHTPPRGLQNSLGLFHSCRHCCCCCCCRHRRDCWRPHLQQLCCEHGCPGRTDNIPSCRVGLKRHVKAELAACPAVYRGQPVPSLLFGGPAGGRRIPLPHAGRGQEVY
ncbi:uncharacterized protein C19orf44 homolog isoform X3 [Paroedura picta]|uniref:uncharacterized protein C19orf44 homolog isoform X3 n=1 Tax=Paroedura picta TaxID=143630 RepID=UPI004056E07E